MALYLIDRHSGPTALALAASDPDAKVVLIQDGVYLDPSPVEGREVYAVERDVRRRGLDGRLPSWVKVVDYGALVDLIAADKVLNFT